MQGQIYASAVDSNSDYSEVLQALWSELFGVCVKLLFCLELLHRKSALALSQWSELVENNNVLKQCRLQSAVVNTTK